MDRIQDQIISRLKPEKTKLFEEFLPTDDFIADQVDKVTNPIAIALFQEQGKNVLEFLGDDRVFEVNQRVREFIRARVDKFAVGFGERIREKLTNEVTQAVANGETIDQITRRITDVFDIARRSDAARIARTEVSRYSNGAATEAYRQTGYVEAKEWFANPDACEFCQALDGKIVSLNNEFAGLGGAVFGGDGGIYNIDFESVGEPPLHPNCECTILPVAVK